MFHSHRELCCSSCVYGTEKSALAHDGLIRLLSHYFTEFTFTIIIITIIVVAFCIIIDSVCTV